MEWKKIFVNLNSSFNQCFLNDIVDTGDGKNCEAIKDIPLLLANFKAMNIQYSIDGRSFQRLEVKGNGPLTLGKGLAKDEEHIVTLVRSSEGQAGISEFKGFIMEKGGRLISPPQDKKRRLE